jgi:hypothetical protein
LELTKLAKTKNAAGGVVGKLPVPVEDKDKKGGRKSYKDRMAEKKQKEEEDEAAGGGAGPTSARKSLKQRQEDRKLEKEDMEARRNVEKADPGLVQEVVCETQICGACKAVVEEFGRW